MDKIYENEQEFTNKDLCTNCKPYIDTRTLLLDLKNYQKVLSRLVKRFSGMSVDQKLRFDIENFLVDFSNLNPEDLIKKDFYGMVDLITLVPYLYEIYPEETKRAKARVKVKEDLKPIIHSKV